MGTLFMVNPPKKKTRKRRRTAKQKAATQKMLAANKRARRVRAGGGKKRRARTSPTNTGVAMPRKRSRKRAATQSRVKRRRRTAGTAVARRRRRAAPVVQRRKRRRAGYSGNPGVFGMLKQGVMDAGATLVGGAVARTVSGVLPLPKTGLGGIAGSLVVAGAIGYAARKAVNADTARFITAGAMQVPLKNLITTMVPQAAGFLGDYDNIGTYQLPSGMGDYLNPGPSVLAGAEEEAFVEVGSY